MYQAKNTGRNGIRFFDPQMQAGILERVTMESDLYNALAKNQFSLYYQIQIDIEGQIIGAEALLRWLHPQRGCVSPLEFIPLAEETGLILPIGQWVLECVCKLLRDWRHSEDMRDICDVYQCECKAISTGRLCRASKVSSTKLFGRAKSVKTRAY